MVQYADKLVGQLVQALEKSGERENTLLLFTGDNGTTYAVKVTGPSPGVRRMVATQGRAGTLVEAGALRLICASNDCRRTKSENEKGGREEVSLHDSSSLRVAFSEN